VCKCDVWREGTVIALQYREQSWPLDRPDAPYQVRLLLLMCSPKRRTLQYREQSWPLDRPDAPYQVHYCYPGNFILLHRKLLLTAPMPRIRWNCWTMDCKL
jgi:hypothetical protein